MSCVVSRREHELVEIDSRWDGDAHVVVRWCTLCGAVVVDADVDGRTAPGAISVMRFPKLALDLQRVSP
jgi:hypothetical protein